MTSRDLTEELHEVSDLITLLWGEIVSLSNVLSSIEQHHRDVMRVIDHLQNPPTTEWFK